MDLYADHCCLAARNALGTYDAANTTASQPGIMASRTLLRHHIIAQRRAWLCRSWQVLCSHGFGLPCVSCGTQSAVVPSRRGTHGVQVANLVSRV
jgi:hypothetical protein